jgi:hypothetical protein
MGLVDGDDVWPELTVEQLHEIAAHDRRALERELKLSRRPEVARRLADAFGGATYTLAERVRHVRGLVELMEGGGVPHPGEFSTELHCRSMVQAEVGLFSQALSDRLHAELLEPLDRRLDAVTVDDGGALLRALVELGDPVGPWWSRRPLLIDEWWMP